MPDEILLYQIPEGGRIHIKDCNRDMGEALAAECQDLVCVDYDDWSDGEGAANI